MTLSFTPNPFTLVWDGLWTMVERNTTLMQMVRKGNRIKYTEEDQLKRAISDGDLPELSLLSEGFDGNIMDSSSSSRLTHKYTWGITTGNLEINPLYNIVSWEVFRSMIDWDVVLCALEWPEDHHFVVRVNILSAEEGNIMIQQNRGIRGWAGMLTIDVMMDFPTSLLRIS